MEITPPPLITKDPSLVTLYIVQYQVLPSDLGDPESDEWGGWRRKGQNSYNIATQVSMIMYLSYLDNIH